MRTRPFLSLRDLSFALGALGLVLAACSSPSDGGAIGSGDSGFAADSPSGDPDAASGGDGGGGSPDGNTATDSGRKEAGLVDSNTTGDGGMGFMQTCTTPGTPGDCPSDPSLMLTCRRFPNKGADYCTHPCSLGCPAPSSGCSAGSGMCAAP